MSRFIRFLTLCGGVATLCLPTPSAQATHPRPKSASPTKASLVPAFNRCSAPNRTHGPPLAFGSCNPPAQSSAQATVGTPDAFGGAANSANYFRLKAFPAFFPPDHADIYIYVALNDVRCVPTGSRCGTVNASGPADYSGEMRFSFTFRVTDHNNAIAPGGGTDAATVQEFDFEHSWGCVQSTSSSTAGSTCDLNTSLQAIIPNGGLDDRRSIWALQAVRIFDGGADGDGDTSADNTVFARQGVFIP